MRIHGLLAWFDEPIPSLVACITGLRRAGVDHLVAVDGRYALYDAEEPVSHPNQHGAIALTCRELGMALTLHAPSEPWAENEVEKRTALFAFGWACAKPGDWFWVQDADMVTTEAPADLKARLEATEHPTAEVEVLDTVLDRANLPDYPSRFAMRSLFRAQPITVGPAHCNYTAADGTPLWAGTGMGDDTLASTLDLSGCVRVEHRTDARPHERQAAKAQYYAVRDDAGVEGGTCDDCGEPAVRHVATGWRKSHLGPVAKWVEACEPCASRREKIGQRQLRQLGVDPEAVRVENHNGRMPAGMTA